MKALNLKMTSFGPYKNEVNIDFKKLNESKLFLITGSTGSGKTTILDGMCMALYCRSTGGLRSFSDMRNIISKDNEPTVVELIFSIGEDVYKIKRTLKIHKLRGKERTEIRDEHEAFVFKSGEFEEVVSGSERKVTEFVEEIIGLNCDQFSKVIVLPQGEFRNLLLANSREKSKIFETLFNTERWSKISERIQNIANESKKQCDELMIKKNSILNRENVLDIEELETKIKNISLEIDRIKKESKTAEEKHKKAILSLQTAENISDIQENFNFEICKEYKFEDLEKYLNKAKEYPILLSKYKTLQNIDKEYKTLDKIKSDIKEKEEELKEQEECVLKLKEKKLNLQKKLNLNIAFSLFKELKESEPCPVCGSIHHPKNVFDELENITQKDINEVSANIDIKQSFLYNINAMLVNLQYKLTNQQEICDSFNIYYVTFSKEIEKAEEKLNKSKRAVSIIISAKNALKNNVKESEKNVHSILKKIGQLSEAYESSCKSLKLLRAIEVDTKKAMKEFSESNRLASLLTGNNAKKIPIKMFVLSIMLDDMLCRANVYFAVFSKYRYSLNRVEKKISSRGYKGLEIEVFDAHLGDVRSVDTLSGGELFLASLSLAFGLSDTVQSYSGGISIDSIFIDEGFGTLDSETLDIAMQAFSEIQKSGRIIGVISHIKELKNYICTNLDINKDKICIS